MTNKLELYREVLEIEPNSKVFFPLARLLAEAGQDDEAVRTLTRGIGFHPDHLEAKFFLIELLTRLGRTGEADAVFADVGGLLARYPSVWLLWSRTAATRSKDPALAMLFLANYFQDQTLTWAEVMERGLRSLRQTAEAAARETAPETTVPVGAPPEHPAPEAEQGGTPGLRGAREVRELAADLLTAPRETAEKAKGRTKGRDADVRTKTMAALLAQQGDTAGAKAIYAELLTSLPPGPEREEISALSAALDTPEKGADAPVASDEEAASRPAEPAAGGHKNGGPAKLVSFLEALAGRLDARAGG